MKKKLYTVGAFCFMLIAVVACKPKYSAPDLNAGTANFDRFVMVGDGHSAGYMDDALYHEGQKSGLAVLLATQFELLGGEAFSTRFVSENSVGANAFGQSRLILGQSEDCNGEFSLAPVRKANVGDLSIVTVTTFSGEAQYGNLTVSGMGVLRAISPNYAQFNPFYARFASSSSASVLEDAVSLDPTFFGIYLGIEDVMGYARSGGLIDNMPEPTDFSVAYDEVVQSLVAGGARGFVATIPDVRSMPFFRTVPYDGLNIQDSSDVNALQFLSALGLSFSLGPNPFTIMDPDANEFEVRQMVDGELVLLSIPLDSVRCFGWGSIFPFRNEFVLTLDEQTYLKNRIDAFNDIIREVAGAYNLAVVETNSLFEKLLTGFIFNGVNFSAQFVSGGAFSLDGIHLNPKGNALLANEFINAINEHYGTNLPKLNPGNFNGVLFP